ncbi:hypothetical protein AB0K08_15440 [Citricoccus sp. NPDC055426]|uniref:AMIN-like domain-containing (lipo)protein n=1 Tax=Citricoccus sp. NPDC055426 TaxID=3155536 RepID=UPI0034184E09
MAAPPPTQAAPYCGIYWGSLDKDMWKGEAFSPDAVKAVRSGRHACFDRLVIDLRGEVCGYHVGYQPVAGNNGRNVPLRGTADLLIYVTSPSLAANGQRTWTPPNKAP